MNRFTKRMIALLLVFAFAVALVGCAGGETTDSSGDVPSGISTSTTLLSAVASDQTTTSTTGVAESTTDSTTKPLSSVAPSVTANTSTNKTTTTTTTTTKGEASMSTTKQTTTSTPAKTTVPTQNAEWKPQDGLKILAIGNSFAEDTFWLTPKVATSMGLTNITFAHLYFGGCSINQHLVHAKANSAAYVYRKSDGGEWSSTVATRMSTALKEEQWDWVILSSGTGDGSRWTEAASYANLSQLIQYVKQYVPSETKIAFNVTWTGEVTYSQSDLLKYNGDQIAMLDAINAIIKADVATLDEIDAIIPTGVAVQNLREYYGSTVSRDGYHLSYDLGRYTAAVTALMVLTGCPDVEKVTYRMNSKVMQTNVFRCITNALKTPYTVTKR